MQKYFKIGEISRLYGIGVDSLRYYEKIGLLNPLRAESGYRYYSVREIWKLNVIRDLRELNFSLEQIGRYLQRHSIDSTLELLQQEEQTIGEKIRELQSLQKNVERRMDSIRRAAEKPTDLITLEPYPQRRCRFLPEGYSEEHEMDVLIKRLLNTDRDHLYLIGNNQIGTAIPLQTFLKTGKLQYAGVFAIDENGEQILPAGNYLTVVYRGDYRKSEDWAKRMIRYAQAHQIRLKGDILELLLVDIHVSSDQEEHITELQILTE